MSYYETQVTVYRNNDFNNKIVISSAELAPGDIFQIPEQQKMPCDAILLMGTCIMNEAMLTGESIPVIKTPLPNSDSKFDPAEDKQFTLYAGTLCIKASNNVDEKILGMVTQTGFTTAKGELIRTMMFPKPSNFKFYQDSFRFIGLLALMAIAGNSILFCCLLRVKIEFCIDLKSFLDTGNASIIKIIIKSSEIITVTVPPALPTCMSIGISVAIKR